MSLRTRRAFYNAVERHQDWLRMYEKFRAHYDKHGEYPKRDIWRSPKRFGHRYSTLTELNARGIDFSHGTFYNVQYRNCDFTGANFGHITGGWGGPDIWFKNCSLKNATLPTDLSQVWFDGCNLSGAKFDSRAENTYHSFVRDTTVFHACVMNEDFLQQLLQGRRYG